MRYVDIGLNLTHAQFAHDRREVWQRARAAGVDKALLTGTDLVSSQQALNLAETLGQGLYCTAGVHPHDAAGWQPETASALRTLLQQPQVKAVGETGLDFNRNFSSPEAQRTAFEAQVELAHACGKPLFLHEREASDALLEILRPWRTGISAAVVHCFTGTMQALKQYLDLDFYIGITGWVCDERRGGELQSLIPYIPGNRLLIETDAPFLLPRDLAAKPKSRRNEPCFLPHIAERIAALRNEPLSMLAPQLYENSCNLFRLD